MSHIDLSRHRRHARERLLRHRERIAAGMICVTVEIDEQAAIEVLARCGQLDPRQNHSRAAIGEAIERLLEALGREA